MGGRGHAKLPKLQGDLGCRTLPHPPALGQPQFMPHPSQEEDQNYEEAFGNADCKIDPRSQLPIIEPDPAALKHCPAFFREPSTVFYFFRPVKEWSSDKGKWVARVPPVPRPAPSQF